MRPLSGQVNIHLAQLLKRGQSLFFDMRVLCHYHQLFIEIFLPRAEFEPGLRVNVYLNLTHDLTHSATMAGFLTMISLRLKERIHLVSIEHVIIYRVTCYDQPV